MPITANKNLPEQFGRYRITRLIGEGGMGAVYLARDTQLDRDVALKIPQFGDNGSSGLLDRFYQEARAAATVQHPNICPIFDVGEIDKIHYLTMAFIDGVPLEKWAVGEKAITIRQLAVLVRKIALAMHEAHKKGVIHRDLKPSNVMIDRRGEPIVMDFGLARRIQAGDQRLTQSGAIMGSPAYMAPEQVKGDQSAIGPASDIYALGVILYELLTHRLPFVGEDNLAVLAQVLLDEPPTPSSFRPDLDAALEVICLKAMAKKSENRHASMADLAAALQDYLRGSPKQPEPKPQDAAATLPPSKGKTDPPGIRVSQMGGLKSMAKFQGQIPLERKLDSPPSKRRRKKNPQRGGPIWIWIGGGCAAAIVLGFAAVIVFSKSGERKTRPVESEIILATAEPHSKSTTKAAPAETSPAPATTPRTGTDKAKPQHDIPAGMIQSNFGMDLVLVPKGRAWLGGGKDKPGVEVTIDYDFYLGRYEVTQGEWERITENNPSYFSRKGLRNKDVAGLTDAELRRLPVDRVTWQDCQDFVANLNKRFPQNGWIYRLPTVLEWEYACRGGPMADKSEGNFDFYFDHPTNELSSKDANYIGSGLGRTVPVGSYLPNRLGLFDMLGNVWEWCDDQRTGKNRTLCASLGGGFKDPPSLCKPTAHGDADPLWTDETRGLRIARVPISRAKPLNSSAAGDAATIKKQLDELMESCRDQIGCSAAVLAIERKGAPLYFQAYGSRDKDRNVPTEVATLFPLGDMASQLMLKASILQLAANKQLDLSASCLKFLNIKPRGKVVDDRVWDITIAHLIDETAGWDDEWLEKARSLARVPKNSSNVEPVLAVMATAPLKDAPGSKSRLSLFSVEILKHIFVTVARAQPVDYIRTKLLGREISGIALGGSVEAQSNTTWNAGKGVICVSAPAMLECMRQFGRHGEPALAGYSAKFSILSSSASCWLLWRPDGINAAIFFNGWRSSGVHDVHAKVDQLIDSWYPTKR
jgi:serine/threonine protein kinase